MATGLATVTGAEDKQPFPKSPGDSKSEAQPGARAGGTASFPPVRLRSLASSVGASGTAAATPRTHTHYLQGPSGSRASQPPLAWPFLAQGKPFSLTPVGKVGRGRHPSGRGETATDQAPPPGLSRHQASGSLRRRPLPLRDVLLRVKSVPRLPGTLIRQSHLASLGAQLRTSAPCA